MPIAEKKPIFDDVADWPTPSPAVATTGHNKPPLEELIPAEFREALLADAPDFLTRFEQLIDAANRAEATNEETLGRCGNLVNAYRKCIKHIDDVHVTVKAPYLLGGKLCDAEKNALRGKVDEAKKRVEGIGNAFVAKRDAEQRAERERIAAEQRAAAERAAEAERERERAEQAAILAQASATSDAERQAADKAADEAAEAAEEAMAAAALAPAMPDKAEPVRSDEGAVVSGKMEWKSEVTDYTLAFMAVEDNPRVREAIDKAIAQLVKAGKRAIDGVRIWPVAKANFR
jgi:hypothetical protein